MQDYNCIVIDWPMTTTIVVFRSMTDLIYFFHMLLQVIATSLPFTEALCFRSFLIFILIFIFKTLCNYLVLLINLVIWNIC
jgi:hypothetical protein